MKPVRYPEVPPLVVDEIPEFRAMQEKHLRDNDEVLPHVLFGDLSRFAVAAHKRGDTRLVERVIGLMERLLRDGDAATRELVGVSFVENIGPEDVEEGFFALYGPLLRADFKASWGLIPPRRDIANPSQ